MHGMNRESDRDHLFVRKIDARQIRLFVPWFVPWGVLTHNSREPRVPSPSLTERSGRSGFTIGGPRADGPRAG